MAKSIADLFDERGSNQHTSRIPRSNSDVATSGQDRQRLAQVEETAGKDPLTLMSPEDAKQVTASNINVSDAIAEIGSLWSGKKTVEGSRDLSKYADKKDVKDDDDEGEE